MEAGVGTLRSKQKAQMTSTGHPYLLNTLLPKPNFMKFLLAGVMHSPLLSKNVLFPKRENLKSHYPLHLELAEDRSNNQS